MPEPCSLVPGETLERYVPNSEPPVPSEARNSADARYEACEWAEPMGAAGSAETLTSHRLNVAVRLHLDGTEPAKSEYDAAWGGARSMAGTADGAAGALHAEAPVTMGIGDQAFAQHLTLSGSLGRSGSVAATVRLRNAVISVRYRGRRRRAGVDGAPKAARRRRWTRRRRGRRGGGRAGHRGHARGVQGLREPLAGRVAPRDADVLQLGRRRLRDEQVRLDAARVDLRHPVAEAGDERVRARLPVVEHALLILDAEEVAEPPDGARGVADQVLVPHGRTRQLLTGGLDRLAVPDDVGDAVGPE